MEHFTEANYKSTHSTHLSKLVSGEVGVLRGGGEQMKKSKKKKEDEEISADTKFNNLLIFCFFLPVVLVLVLRLFNVLYVDYGFDINPEGLNNATWVTFWGSYFGGCFTLFAFIGTIEHNKANLEITIEASKKQLKEQMEYSNRQSIFEAEQENIRQTRSLIAETVSSFRPLLVCEIYEKLQQTTMGSPEATEIGLSNALIELDRALDHQNSLHLRLQFEEILKFRCLGCKNRTACELGKAKIDLATKYQEVHHTLFTSLSHLRDYVSALKLDKESVDDETRLVIDDIQQCHELYLTGIPRLVEATNTYILYRKHLSIQVLENTEILNYEEDSEEIKKLVAEHEAKLESQRKDAVN